jgi:hypothetical protein
MPLVRISLRLPGMAETLFESLTVFLTLGQLVLDRLELFPDPLDLLDEKATFNLDL